MPKPCFGKSLFYVYSAHHNILKTHYISFILQWVGYACFKNREGVNELRSFRMFEYSTFFFSVLCVILLSNTNCTYMYKDCETAKLRGVFVMSDLSSAKLP